MKRMNLEVMNNATLNEFDMARILKYQNANTGVYGLMVKSVFPTIEGEEWEWDVQPAHGDGKVGIALLRNVYDPDTDAWWHEPAVFLWFPEGYTYGGDDYTKHFVYEVIGETPLHDMDKFHGRCIEVGGVRNLSNDDKSSWTKMEWGGKSGLGLFYHDKTCLIFTFPDNWVWHDGIPYHA